MSEITDEMKQDRIDCMKRNHIEWTKPCDDCSCHKENDSCVYDEIETVADWIKSASIESLAIYLHSWESETMTVDEIKMFLVDDVENYQYD